MEVENLNMKKLFPDKKLTRKGFLEFLDKKGFYIILILCIAVVGATAVFVTTNNVTSSKQDLNAEKIIPDELSDDSITDVETEPVEESPIGSAATLPEKAVAVNDTGGKAEKATDTVAQKTETKPAAPKTDSKSPANTNKEPADKKTTDTKSTGKAQNQEFIMPVVGGVTFVFAQDKLVYSKTLEEWRTHSGIDLAADRGTAVKVVADGVVSEIKNDPRFGITVIVNHDNGLQTVYANLASDDMVNPNQKLKQGDIIGCVGNTALFESAEQSHLHFEVLKDNEIVNPESYLPLNKK